MAKKKKIKSPCTTIPIRQEDAVRLRKIGADKGWSIVTTLANVLTIYGGAAK
jgi:hypothetical protein